MPEGPSIDPQLRWKEVKPPPQMRQMGREMGVTPRAYQAYVEDGHLTVFVCREPNERGEMKLHLSISHGSNIIVNPAGGSAPGRLPTWDEIKDARYRFCSKHCWMAIMLPPPEVYLNMHPTTMHLHEVDDPELL